MASPAPYITEVDTKQATTFKDEVEHITVGSDDSAETAQELRDHIRLLRTDVTKRQKAAKAPFKKLADEAYNEAKPVLKTLNDALAVLDEKLKRFVLTRELQRAEAQIAEHSPPPPAPVKTKRAVVLNITDPALVPQQYWKIDEVMLRRDLEDGVSVPGAELKEVRRLN